MTTTPTPEQFLSAPFNHDDDYEEEHAAAFGPGGCDLTVRPDDVWQLPQSPLESIAESLRELVAIHSGPANIPAAEHLEVAEERDLLRERCADAYSKYEAAVAVIDQISALVKPSTSKLANSVREVIAGWAAPQVPEPEPEDAERLQPPPAPEAPVEEWRAYAHERGYPEGTVLDQMNRSQIRTMLGIEQPVSGEGTGESA